MSAPNLHPLVVHFPVVLLLVALALEGLGRARPALAGRGLRAGAWGSAALAATAAFLTGRLAADGLTDVAPEAHAAIGAHADAALGVVGAAIAAAALRALSLVGRGRAAGGLAVLVGALACGLVAWTADLGGTLVFTHGVGMHRPPAPAPTPAPAVEAPEATPFAGVVDDGRTLIWTPRPVDLGPEGAWPAEGAALRVDGTRELLLPGTFDDVQLNAWLDLRGFTGTIRLLHHVGPDGAGALSWTSSGAVRLETLAPAPAVLDRADAGTPARVLAVNVAGSHQKGLLDGAVVAHGHAPALPPGQVGLRLEGEGVVGLHRLEAIRLGTEAP